MFYRKTPEKITVKDMAARCQVFNRKINGFLQCTTGRLFSLWIALPDYLKVSIVLSVVKILRLCRFYKDLRTANPYKTGTTIKIHEDMSTDMFILFYITRRNGTRF